MARFLLVGGKAGTPGLLEVSTFRTQSVDVLLGRSVVPKVIDPHVTKDSRRCNLKSSFGILSIHFI